MWDSQPCCESLFSLLLLLFPTLPLLSRQLGSALTFSALFIQLSQYCILTGATLRSWFNKDWVIRLFV